MVEEFTSKLKNNEYISNYLYESIKEENGSVIPKDFNIDEYNEKVLDKLYKDNKEYFDNMYKGIDDNIHLDEEQCKAILADEKYSLIIAGAGTGKTTTMVSKVKYLVDKKNADPNRILVMSYTRKATEEIAKRIGDNFNLPVHVTTFHSLGYEYIREIYPNHKCVIMDKNKRNEIYLEYFRELFKHRNLIQEIYNNFEFLKVQRGFVFSNYFMDNYEKFDTYDDFVDSYVEHKIEEAKKIGVKTLVDEWVERQLLKDSGITAIKGEYVKSAGEMIIANFLFSHGIDYSYEEVYDELMENRSIYRPDFTIDYAGEKIYIEYFGLDDPEYNRIRKWKEDFHKSRGNKFIEINRLPLNRIVSELDRKLRALNVNYKEIPQEQIYEHILRLNPLSQVFPFLYFLHDCVIAKKESVDRENPDIEKKYLDTISKDNVETFVQYKYIQSFTKFYSQRCFGGDVYYFDFEDLLYYSTKYMEKLTIDSKLRFNNIIIDEYQDISHIKYKLTFKTAMRNNANVYAVGDDWQSIYAFSGSRIEYIYNFKNYFEGSKTFKISRTYRNSQELIDYSGKFIMENPDQLKKQLMSNKHITDPIVYKYFNSQNGKMDEIAALKEVILEIHNVNPDHKILVLARTNYMVNRVLEDAELINDVGTKIIFRGHEDIYIDNMTMHKSKGLTYDDVIIIGLDKRFPHPEVGRYWYIELYRNKPIQEKIPFAEERRLFYVALTRTKNKVYLLVDENANKRSEFIAELDKIIKEVNN